MTVYVQDDFTGADGSPLNGRTSSAGTSWTTSVFSAGFPTTTIQAQIASNNLVVTQGAEFAGAQLLAYPSGALPGSTTAYDITVGFLADVSQFTLRVCGVVNPANPIDFQLLDLYCYGEDSPGMSGIVLNATNTASDEYTTVASGAEHFLRVAIDPVGGTATIYMDEVLVTSMDMDAFYLTQTISSFVLFASPDTFSTSPITSILISSGSEPEPEPEGPSAFWTSFVNSDEVL
jgi:hypothetical protein